jgi:hypothetical protein
MIHKIEAGVGDLIGDEYAVTGAAVAEGLLAWQRVPVFGAIALAAVGLSMSACRGPEKSPLDGKGMPWSEVWQQPPPQISFNLPDFASGFGH